MTVNLLTAGYFFIAFIAFISLAFGFFLPNSIEGDVVHHAVGAFIAFGLGMLWPLWILVAPFVGIGYFYVRGRK